MSSIIIDKPKVDIAEELLAQLKSETEEEGQVVLHVIYHAPEDYFFALIRIWQTTFLYDHDSDHRSELVHAENITYYPVWHQCKPGVDNYFTLIFSGLPKSCTMFDFIEHCAGSSGGEFEVHNIPRNNSDVYYVKVF